MKARVPVLAITGAALVVAVMLAIAVIPVPKPKPDFSRLPRSDAGAGVADGPAKEGVKGRETAWADLVPPGWDPPKQIADLRQDLSKLSDSDPRAAAIIKRMREVWDHAPPVAAMDGAAVRIAGYVVPLEASGRRQAEFLLVPYFGACIHAPPPPANQIIHVLAQPRTPRLHTMDTVWVSGVLAVMHSESEMGASGYRLDATAVEAYVQRR
jgi:uncharacterized protein